MFNDSSCSKQFREMNKNIYSLFIGNIPITENKSEIVPFFYSMLHNDVQLQLNRRLVLRSESYFATYSTTWMKETTLSVTK